MLLPVSTGVAYDELESSVKTLTEWMSSLKKGVPGITAPGEQEQLVDWLRNFRGELLFVSDKVAALATRMTEIE